MTTCGIICLALAVLLALLLPAIRAQIKREQQYEAACRFGLLTKP